MKAVSRLAFATELCCIGKLCALLWHVSPERGTSPRHKAYPPGWGRHVRSRIGRVRLARHEAYSAPKTQVGPTLPAGAPANSTFSGRGTSSSRSELADLLWPRHAYQCVAWVQVHRGGRAPWGFSRCPRKAPGILSVPRVGCPACKHLWPRKPYIVAGLRPCT